MDNQQSLQESTGSVLYKMSLGRIYFLKQIFAKMIFRYLTKIGNQQIEEGSYQVSVFAFDLIGHQINLRGVFEREELTAVIGYLKSNKLVKGAALDIGANIGNHSLFFSRYYERVYCFEPNPRTFQLLKMNGSLVNNIECINVGLSDFEGKGILSNNPSNMGAASLAINSGTNQSNQHEIELRTLDSFSDIYSHGIGLIKIDVEGHELAVLKGAEKFINKNRPTILFEQHLTEFKDGKSPIVEYLKTIGYKRFASVMPSPAIQLWVPGFIRKPLIFILRLIFGLSYKVVERETFPPNFYAFIIAIP